MFDKFVKTYLTPTLIKEESEITVDNFDINNPEHMKKVNELFNNDPLQPKTTEDSVIDKIELALHKIGKLYPFFGALQLKNLNFVYNHPDIATMAVDKSGNLYINTDFATKLSPSELMGVLIHEIMHVAMLDLFRIGNRDPMLMNIASDLVNNWFIYNDGKGLRNEFTLPIGCLMPDVKDGILKSTIINNKVVNLPQNKWIDLNTCMTEEVYELLKNLDPAFVNSLNNRRFDVHVTVKKVTRVPGSSKPQQSNTSGDKKQENLQGSFIRDKITGETGVVVGQDFANNTVDIVPLTKEQLEEIKTEIFFKKKGKPSVKNENDWTLEVGEKV